MSEAESLSYNFDSAPVRYRSIAVVLLKLFYDSMPDAVRNQTIMDEVSGRFSERLVYDTLRDMTKCNLAVHITKRRKFVDYTITKEGINYLNEYYGKIGKTLLPV
jgi:hypothetical protein